MPDKPIYKYFRCPAPKCGYKQRDYTGKQKGKCPKCEEVCYVTENWYAAYTNAQGKPREKSCSPVYKDAEAFLEDVNRSKRLGQLLPDEREPEKVIPWQEAAREFQKWIDEQKPNTQHGYNGRMKVLTKWFGDKTLQDITLKDVETFKKARTKGHSAKEIEQAVEQLKRELRHEPLAVVSRKVMALRNHMAPIAPSTVNTEIHVLLKIYQMFCRWHDPEDSPKLHARYRSIQLIKRAKVDNVKERVPEREDFGRMLDEALKTPVKGTKALQGYAYMILVLGVKTCLRPINIYRLRRSQIDFEAMTITIPREELKVGSKRPDHVIPMDAELAQELRQYIVKHGTFDLLFPSLKDPTQPIKRCRKIDTIIKRVGINNGVTHNKNKITMYTATRHTGLTWLGEATEDAKTLAAMADHANPAMTLKRYVKKSQEKLTNLVNNHGVKLSELKGEKG
jgi:integrase